MILFFRKYFLIFISLMIISSCSVKNNKNYPFKIVGKDNYLPLKTINSNVRSIGYVYCNKVYFVFPVEKYDFSNIVNIAIEEFFQNNSLKSDEYIANIKVERGKTFMFPLLYTKGCLVVFMDIVK